eukprot:UN09088
MTTCHSLHLSRLFPFTSHLSHFTLHLLHIIQTYLNSTKLPHSIDYLTIKDFALLPTFRHECILLCNTTLNILIQNITLYLFKLYLSKLYLSILYLVIILILVIVKNNFSHCFRMYCVIDNDVSVNHVKLQLEIVIVYTLVHLLTYCNKLS